jgi:hypothetical protein
MFSRNKDLDIVKYNIWGPGFATERASGSLSEGGGAIQENAKFPGRVSGLVLFAFSGCRNVETGNARRGGSEIMNSWLAGL